MFSALLWVGASYMFDTMGSISNQIAGARFCSNVYTRNDWFGGVVAMGVNIPPGSFSISLGAGANFCRAERVIRTNVFSAMISSLGDGRFSNV